ncbi:YDG domain-containing protein [Sphaerochaeta sp. UBA5836]|uniref:YDG domain-containing protein n=1 Tax=Sphaerochaeta sp. UBA5836 TaxID=1947474 RepID=UPI0025EFACB5|nr:YDG domain-containing protein [Sphaerochaeta sp. UBA5836]
MKKTTITLLFIATILLSFTACSDMMEKLGNINLTIVLDTPDIAVASYRLEGLHDNPNSRFTVHDIVPPRHTLSSLKSGLWTITVTAFDAAGTQLGAGTTRINLREGQIVETTLLVVFSQDAPTSSGFTFSAPTRFDSADGRMSGTTAAMEYRLATDPADAPYTACSEGTTILGTGTYLIRYAAAHGLRASDPLSVTVPLYQPIQLTIADPTLNTNKTYDGTVEITGSATAGALVGIVGTDDVTINTLATYDNKAAGSGKIITVTYTLGGPDAGNYIKPVDTVVIGVIEKRQLTISGTTIAATKIYDRSPLTTVTSPGMLGGVIGSDEVTVAPTASCTDSNVGNDKPVTITYTLGGRDGGNYLVADNHSEQTSFTEAVLTATVGDYSKTYGENNPSYTVVVSGFVPGEDADTAAGYTAPSASSATDATTAIGTYPITIAGGSATNYSFVTSDTGNLTVNKATMGGSVSISGTAAYGQVLTAVPSLANTGTPTYQWKRNGNAISGATGTTYTLVSADIGSTITVTATATGANYQGTKDSAAPQAGVITPKQLGIQILDLPSNKVYDGTTSAAAPTFNLYGKIGSDDVVVTATATYETPTAGTGKRISIVYSLSGADKDNYLKPADILTTASCAIIKKQLTISDPILGTNRKVYDGTTAVQDSVTPGTLSGVLEGDDVTVGAAASYQSANVTTATGGFNPITVVYSLGGLHANNYYPPVNKQLWGAIEKKQLSVIGTAFPASKVYDKSSAITITAAGTLTGMVAGDDVTLGNVTAYYSGTYTMDVGIDKPVTVYYTISGSDAGNYYLNNDTSRTASIAPVLLTATVGDYTQTYGEAIPTFLVDVTGFVPNDNAIIASGYSSPTATAGTTSTSAAGIYTIRITGGSARNYSFNVNDTGTLTIQKLTGAAISGTIDGYYPNSNEGQTIINVTGFSPNQTGIEAEIAYYDTFIPYYPDFAIDSRGRTILYLPSPASTTTKIRFRVKETSTHAPGPATEITLAPRPLAIGDYYGGGIVAYISSSSTLAEETNGLIAAKSDITTTGLAWSSSTNTVVGTSADYGKGLSNSDKIMNSSGASSFSFAAFNARYYNGGGYNDWFLPSKDELINIHSVFNQIGNFSTSGAYWSSTELSFRLPYDGSTVYALEFGSNTASWSWKTETLLVRPVRYF